MGAAAELWTPGAGPEVLIKPNRPDLRKAIRWDGDRELFVIPDSREAWAAKRRPYRTATGLGVFNPLDLRAELRRIQREERVREECERLNVPHVLGEAAGAWTFVNSARLNMVNGTFDFDTDSFKIALFLSTSNLAATSTTFAGLTNEHAAANGYTAGGIAAVMAVSTVSTSQALVDETGNPVWTASGGSITARWGVFYEVAGNVVCYFLLDSLPQDVTATDGNTLTITIAANGIFLVQ